MPTRVCGSLNMISDFSCVTQCTSTPSTRACSLWGRNQLGKKKKCKQVWFGKNTYYNGCSRDPNWPTTNPNQECSENNQASYKYCLIQAHSITALNSATNNDPDTACAAYNDENNIPRTVRVPAYQQVPNKPYFTEQSGWLKLVCEGTSGIDTNAGAHQQYYDQIETVQYGENDVGDYGSQSHYDSEYDFHGAMQYNDISMVYALIAVAIFVVCCCLVSVVVCGAGMVTGYFWSRKSAEAVKNKGPDNYNQVLFCFLCSF